MSLGGAGETAHGQDRILWAAMLIGAGVYPLVLIALSGFLHPPGQGSAGVWMAALGFATMLPSSLLPRASRATPAAQALDDESVRRWRMLLGVLLAEIPAAISIVAFLLGAPLAVCLALCGITLGLVWRWRPSAGQAG